MSTGDMKVNVKKTKTTKVSKLTPGILNIKIEGGIVEQVKMLTIARYVDMMENGKNQVEGHENK